MYSCICNKILALALCNMQKRNMFSNFIISPASHGDIDSGYEAALEFQGMTSWPKNQDVLEAKLARCETTFQGGSLVSEDRAYLLVLRSQASEFMGMSGIYPDMGDFYPYWEIDNPKDPHKLTMQADRLKHWSELGTTFLRQEFRDATVNRKRNFPQIGRAMSRARFLLAANNQDAFTDNLFTEFRGPTAPIGKAEVAIFGEQFARHYYRTPQKRNEISFEDLDSQISSRGYREMFSHCVGMEIDLTSGLRYLIPMLGVPHKDSQKAKAILDKEGLRHYDLLGAHDWGVVATGEFAKIKTIKESSVFSVKVSDSDIISGIGNIAMGQHRLVSNLRADQDFCAAFSSEIRIMAGEEQIAISPQLAEIMMVDNDDQIRLAPQ